MNWLYIAGGAAAFFFLKNLKGAPGGVQHKIEDVLQYKFSILANKGLLEGRIPLSFVYAIIWVESQGDPSAVGSAGEKGLMQITEMALEDANKTLNNSYPFYRLTEPDINIEVGMGYLRYIYDFLGSKINFQQAGESQVDASIKSYNIGIGNYLSGSSEQAGKIYLNRVKGARQKILPLIAKGSGNENPGEGGPGEEGSGGPGGKPLKP